MTFGPSAGELTDLIADDIKAMPDTATILRLTSPRTAGGYSQNYASVGTTPCRLTASVLSGGNEQVGAGALVSTMAYTLTVPPGTDIRPSDRIQVGASLFEVLAIKGNASWNLSDACTLMEIRR